MLVFVYFSSNIYNITVDETFTVRDLKLKIKDLMFPDLDFSLFYNKILDDDYTLYDYHIKNKSKIYLITT